jgi:hypothetical protein
MADAKGAEWIATNPTRTDERRGSFMVNLRTKTDFALEVSGGNLTSLAAYLFRVKHGQADRQDRRCPWACEQCPLAPVGGGRSSKPNSDSEWEVISARDDVFLVLEKQVMMYHHEDRRDPAQSIQGGVPNA